jgi:hypothetical protein
MADLWTMDVEVASENRLFSMNRTEDEGGNMTEEQTGCLYLISNRHSNKSIFKFANFACNFHGDQVMHAVCEMKLLRFQVMQLTKTMLLHRLEVL